MAETLRQVFDAARKRLRDTSPTADLDARLLLQEVTGFDHAGFIAADGQALTPDKLQYFETLLARRLAHEPVSRILGWREFYGRRFVVTPDVLDPRPDSEAAIELALAFRMEEPRQILDIGSGSGALIVTLLAAWPRARGFAVDLSAPALAVTRRNAEALGVGGRLSCRLGSVFADAAGPFDLVISNPPYIPTADLAGLAPDVRDHDPQMALDGGEDGLAVYRAIAGGVRTRLAPGGLLVVEIGQGQGPVVRDLLRAAGLDFLASRQDLAGIERALAFGRP